MHRGEWERGPGQNCNGDFAVFWDDSVTRVVLQKGVGQGERHRNEWEQNWIVDDSVSD